MAAGWPDLVDCARLAADGEVLEREYPIAALPRLKDLLAEASGTADARFAFATLPEGRTGASVTVRAEPKLVCQRCLKGFAWPVSVASQIEFATADEQGGALNADPHRECHLVHAGQVSLRDLAEEELLLALPIAPACSTPRTCGNAPGVWDAGEAPAATAGRRRPFEDLRELLKKP